MSSESQTPTGPTVDADLEEATVTWQWTEQVFTVDTQVGPIEVTVKNGVFHFNYGGHDVTAHSIAMINRTIAEIDVATQQMLAQAREAAWAKPRPGYWLACEADPYAGNVVPEPINIIGYDHRKRELLIERADGARESVGLGPYLLRNLTPKSLDTFTRLGNAVVDARRLVRETTGTHWRHALAGQKIDLDLSIDPETNNIVATDNGKTYTGRVQEQIVRDVVIDRLLTAGFSHFIYGRNPLPLSDTAGMPHRPNDLLHDLHRDRDSAVAASTALRALDEAFSALHEAAVRHQFTRAHIDQIEAKALSAVQTAAMTA